MDNISLDGLEPSPAAPPTTLKQRAAQADGVRAVGGQGARSEPRRRDVAEEGPARQRRAEHAQLHDAARPHAELHGHAVRRLHACGHGGQRGAVCSVSGVGVPSRSHLHNTHRRDLHTQHVPPSFHATGGSPPGPADARLWVRRDGGVCESEESGTLILISRCMRACVRSVCTDMAAWQRNV